MREEAGGLVIGGYEPDPKERWIDGVPWEHGGTTMPADYDRFEQLLRKGLSAGCLSWTRRRSSRWSAIAGAYPPIASLSWDPHAGSRVAFGMPAVCH